ncbi:MAG: hypothetical protein ACYSUX_11095 [Planctomycetota bacterium]|jgi:hypothetical protein
MSEENLAQIEKSWRQEPSDIAVLKAATENLNAYPPEVRTIIIEEARKRGLVDSDGRPVPETKVSDIIKDRAERIEDLLLEKFCYQIHTLGAFWIIISILGILGMLFHRERLIDPIGIPNESTVDVVIFVLVAMVWISIGVLIWFGHIWAVYIGLVLSYLQLIGLFLSSPGLAIIIQIMMIIKAHRVIRWAKQMRTVDVWFK